MQPLITLGEAEVAWNISPHGAAIFAIWNIRRLRGRGETLLLRSSLSFFLSLGAGTMDEDDPREEISDLEAKIEELAETIEHCRKLIVLAKGALVLGALALGGFMLGVLGDSPLPLVIGIIGVLGGVVLLGSNMTTADTALEEMKAAEARRAALIGTIDLRVVTNGAGRRTLH